MTHGSGVSPGQPPVWAAQGAGAELCPVKPSCSAPCGVTDAHCHTWLRGVGWRCCPQEQPQANPRKVPQPGLRAGRHLQQQQQRGTDCPTGTGDF